MTKKLNFFITRKIFDETIERIQAEGVVEVWQEDSPPPLQVLIDKASRVDGLFTLLTDPINREVIQTGANHHLKVISQMAVGFDNIDIQSAIEYRIPVGNTPGILTETTADFAWSLLMAAARRVVEGHNEVQRNLWRPWGPEVLCGTDVNGSTLGLIGFGRIGQAMAKRAQGFNMHVLYSDLQRNPKAEKQFHAEYCSLNDLLQRSDFISMHAFLSPESRKMIGKEQFAQMKKNSIFINTARGGLVDHDALFEALVAGKISGAALDVFDPEPIPQNHPLLQLPQVIITPHNASASIQTRKRMVSMAAENLLAGVKGEILPYCANSQVYKI